MYPTGVLSQAPHTLMVCFDLLGPDEDLELVVCDQEEGAGETAEHVHGQPSEQRPQALLAHHPPQTVEGVLVVGGSRGQRLGQRGRGHQVRPTVLRLGKTNSSSSSSRNNNNTVLQTSRGVDAYTMHFRNPHN